MSPRRSWYQTAWVVPDLQKAMQQWVDQAGVGPFFHFAHLTIGDAVYRGSPCSVDISVAIAQAGPMQIELIQQHDDSPSPFASVARDGAVHHHVAALTDDFDADLARYHEIGVEVVFTGLFGDVRFGYFDTRATLGSFTELLERGPSIDGLFEIISQAGTAWDGSDPIRSLPAG